MVENFSDGHLYLYTRDEWSWLTKNLICCWTRRKLPDNVIKAIKSRGKIAKILGDVITYPLAENVDSISASSVRVSSPSYLDNQVEGQVRPQSLRSEGSNVAQSLRSEGSSIAPSDLSFPDLPRYNGQPMNVGGILIENAE